MLNIVLTDSGFVRRVTQRLKLPDAASKILPTGFNVLGISDEPGTDKPPETLQTEYARWQKIVAEYPDYRDGHYMLASIAYQLGNTEAFRKHLEDVRGLDPNYPGLSKLEELLSQE